MYRQLVRILVVENRPEEYEWLVSLLADLAGGEDKIHQAARRDDLNSALQHDDWHVVICGDGMSGLGIGDVLDGVAQRSHSLPILLIAEPDSDEAAMELLGRGLTDYVFRDRPARLPGAVRRACGLSAMDPAIVPDVSSRFSRAINHLIEAVVIHDEPGMILDTLARIVGEVLGLDRTLIYDVRFDDGVAEALSEWLTPERVDLAPTKGVYPIELFAEAATLLHRSHGWLESHADAIHPSFHSGPAGALLHGQMQIDSLLWWPFSFREHGFYLLALNQVGHRREWSQEELGFLESVSRFVSMGMVKIGLLREQHRVTDALSRSERRYREVFENASDIILLAEAAPGGEMALVDVNPVGRAVFGITGEPGLLLSDLVSESTRGVILPHLHACLESGLAHSYLEEMADDRMFQMTLIPISDSGAPVSRILALGRDVTQHLKHEQYVKSISENFEDAIQAIATTLEHRDPYTAGHQRRVAALATAIGKEMGLSDDQNHGLRLVAIVHDLGKIRIPSEILSKPGTLNHLEYEIVKMHSAAAFDILKGIKFPWPIAQAVYQHHERMDGSGYPQGLKGDDILLEARILAVADIVEAMASHRPYRAGLGLQSAFDEILARRGEHYDPEVVDACLRVFTSGRFEFPPG